MSELKIGLEIPRLNDYESYDTYKDVVDLWKVTTDHPKRKLGAYLVTGLPNKSKVFGDNIQEGLFAKHRPAELANDDTGIDKVLNYLDGILSKTPRSQSMEAFAKIHFFRRKPNQKIAEYIREFDILTNKCKNKNCTIDPNQKTFVLLLGANLTQVQYEMVKGIMDDCEDSELYDKVKEKLLFLLTNSLGDVCNNNGNGKSESQPLDEAFFTQHEEAFLSWQSRKKFYQKGKQGSHHQNSEKWNNKSHSNSSQNYKSKANTSYNKKWEEGLNPKDKMGRRLKCRECGSHQHLQKECLYFKQRKRGHQAYVVDGDDSSDTGSVTEGESDYDDANDYVEKQRVLFTNDTADMSRFTAESLCSAALDTCCTASVSGEKWMNIYLQALPAHLKKRVQGPFTTGTEFTFGNNESLKSGKAYKIPVIIADSMHEIVVDVISSDIPLLLSKAHMKKIGIALNMSDDTATANGKPLKVNTTSAGHFIVNLLGDTDNDDSIFLAEVMNIDLIEESDKNVYKLLSKLHKQIGHRPRKVFIEFLKSADQFKDSFIPIIDKIIDGCEGCLLRRRSPDRPAVALNPAKDFNDIIAMDLKIWEGKYILYLVDSFTRYTQATIIPSKEPQEVIKAIIKIWFRIFSKPVSFWFDNGGEFSNNLMMQICSELDIKIHTTGASSPWQNGLVEKNHALVDNILQQVVTDYKELDLETALAWSCYAKNILTNIYGFSPYELVFGRKPNVVDIIESPPTAHEIRTHCKVFEDNMNAKTAATAAFIKAQNCEKLKIALRSKIRTMDHVYHQGDWVYYKRTRDDRWMGPAKVMWQDNKVIMVRHGGYCTRVSANRLLPVKEELRQRIEAGEIAGADIEKELSKSSDDKVAEKETEQNTSKRKRGDIIINDENSDNTTNNEQSDAHRITNDNDINNEQSDVHRSDINTDTATTEEREQDVSNEANVENNPERQKKGPGRPPKHNKNKNTPVFKPQDKILLKIQNEWKQCEILGRAGKATCKTSNTWYNVEMETGEQLPVNMAQQEFKRANEEADLMFTSKQEILAVLVPKDKHNSEECMKAKFDELQKLKEFNTYEEVDDQGQERITTVWVLTEKGVETRARLTARGFQETEDIPKDSPTMHKSSLRLILTLAAANSWQINTTDIKSAFLQGNDLDRVIHVLPPKESNSIGKLWLLRKCLYGLKDASKQWYSKIENHLYSLGFKRADDDYGLFYLVKDGTLQGFIGLHVDDFIHCGNRYFNEVIMTLVLDIFKVGKSEHGNFMYTGFNLQQDENGITLDQNEYVDRVKIPTFEAKRMLESEEDMTDEELTILRQMVGSLNWTVRSTRPDLAFELINLSTKFKGGKVADLKAAKKTLTKLKDKASVRIPKIDLDSAELFLYTDASHGNLNEARDSTGAYILFLIDPQTGRAAALDWKSNKAKRVVHSTLAAEALSLYNGIDAAIATRNLIKDMTGNKYDFKLRTVIDNKDAYDAIHSSTNISERRLRREIASIQQCLARKEVNSVIWVRGEHQLSDVLTKKGADSSKLLAVLQTGYINSDSLAAIRATY